MKKNTIWAATLGLAMALMLATAYGQDFQKAYQVAPGDRISIANVSGEISVTGYNGAAVLVSAYRGGRDRDMVEIEDQSTPGHVSLRVQYPRGGSYDANVRFVVQVPRGPRYLFDSLSTASGDIDISGVAGDVKANTASGNVTLRQVEGNVKASTASGDVSVQEASGTVTASTASGDVDVDLIRVEGDGRLAFSSASGDVTVKAPAQLDADVEMSTASGSLTTDFPLTIDDREGHGRKAYGRLGKGTRPLKISTASGNVRLVRS
jgi:hypothetical protein